MAYEVPPLPYDYNALEPTIDEQTMHLHHDKHHQAYVTDVNAALEGTEWADKPVEEVLQNLDELPSDKRRPGPQQRRRPLQPLAVLGVDVARTAAASPTAPWRDAIDAAFGSFDDFKAQLKDGGVERFGSGWAWLVHDGSGLAIVSTANQDSPICDGKTPLLGVDVWEHAYYLKYQNRRPDYLDAWWNVVNWPKVAERFAAAVAGGSLRPADGSLRATGADGAMDAARIRGPRPRARLAMDAASGPRTA